MDDSVILEVQDAEKGFVRAKKLLYENCDQNTLLLLSGGSTPKLLYEVFAKEGKLRVGSVAIVDERFGESFHENSNELMIKNTGLFNYCGTQNIPVFKILQGKNIKQTAKNYNQTLSTLFNRFSKRVAILGVGPDGHIAGIAPDRPDFQNPIFSIDQQTLVSFFIDPKSIKDGGFGGRVTMTFAALEKMTFIILLAFGENKKEALQKMTRKGSLEEIPARFLWQPHIKNNTLILTDQKI